MRIPVATMCCFQKPCFLYQITPLNEDGIYEVTCKEGHYSVVFYAHQKFEVLFEMGLLAFNDGYAREAVLNFAASLERFHQFFIEVTLGENKRRIDLFKKYLKYSERQLGAFFLAYISAFHDLPDNILDNKKIKSESFSNFRNNIVHDGLLCSMDDSKKYGMEIFSYIKKIYTSLKNRFPSDLEKIINARGIDIAKTAGAKQVNAACVGRNGIFSKEACCENFDDAQKWIKEQNSRE